MADQRVWFYLYLVVFIFLSLSSLSLDIGMKMRINQLLILALFGAVFIDDVIKEQLNLKALSILFVGGVVMSLISLNSTYDKIGEFKFIIKYILIFPATFYIGVRVVDKIGIKNLIHAIEITAFVYALVALIFYFFPLPIFTLIAATAEDGGVLTTYRGTFSETGWFAVVIGAFLLASISLRYDFDIWPKSRVWLNPLYIFLLYSMAMSKNKTVWIAFVVIGVTFIIYKIFANLILSNYYKPSDLDSEDETLKFFSKIKVGKVLLLLGLFSMIFFVVNELLDKPIVSWEMIEVKIEQERGKAFAVAMDLLSHSNWIGGYGFGFIEYFFQNYSDKVLGLGEGVGMLFNSYLDSWISASIFGLLFHLTLLYLSFSHKKYFTIVIPIYFFVFANFNPATGSEYYYIFLGLSYVFVGLSNYKKSFIK